MSRGMDCRHEAHDDMHFTAADDGELLGTVQKHRDEFHPELSDDDIRGLISQHAHDE